VPNNEDSVSVRPELTPYTIITNRVVNKQLGQLSSENEIRVLEALENLALSAVGDVVNVGNNLPGTFQLRVGDLRIYFDVEEQTIKVRLLEKRGEAYRRKFRNR
jgi:mRNA-degrading endonuclease RelE of RelBE toxin-antitoxin system